MAVLVGPLSLGAQDATTADVAAARQQFRQGDFKAAAAAFRKIIEHDPSPQAWAGLIQSLLKLDDVKSATESSQKALEVFPQSALVHAVRGDVEFRRGLMSKAAEEYRTALKIDPSCARALLGQGKLDAVMAHRARAKEEIAKAHELDPDDGDALYEWAVRQAYPADIAGLEKHLAEFRNDAEAERHERDHLELLKALAGRKVWILRSDVTRSELKIEPMLVGTQFMRRGFGLRVGFNERGFAMLLVDTGASGVTISRKFAEKIGARKLSDQEVEGVGRGGGMHAYTAWVDKVTIGELEFHDCFVHVTPQPIPETDGIIGTDIFQNFLVSLDFPGHKLRLEPLPPLAGSGDDPPGQPQRLSQAMAFGHLLLLETRTGEKTSGLFVLDTGSNINTVSPELSKGIYEMRPFNSSGMGMSGAANISSVAENVNLEFAQTRRRGQRLFTVDLHNISKDLGTELSGQIGFSALQEGSVVINYRDGLVGFVERK
jgi:Tfp pilus assembly protein PilF